MREEKISMREMCEHIVKAKVFLEPKTAEEIFNYSPNGELFMIFHWYKMACVMLGENASGDKLTAQEIWDIFKPKEQ